MRDWRGLAAFILALAVAACLVIAFVSAATTDKPIPEWLANLVFVTLGGVIGVVASYVTKRGE